MSIGLAIIAKNEATTLPQLLDSVEGCFDEIALLDTGSTDGTGLVFRQWCGGHKQPFRYAEQSFHPFHFGDARNAAQELLSTDWIVWADCDDEILGADLLRHMAATMPTWHPGAVAYRFPYEIGAILTMRERMVRKGQGKWVGPVHECQVIEGRMVDDPRVRWVHHPERKPAGAKPSRTAAAEISMLAPDALDNTRSMFYLAQACKDSGRFAEAAELYEYRADMEGGWSEEVYVALWHAGLCWYEVDRPDRAVWCLIRATEVNPTRVEALYDLAAGLRLRGQYQAAYMAATRALLVSEPPPDGLFTMRWIYDWGCLFEASISAYYVGEKELARSWCQTLAERDDLPPQIAERNLANLALVNGEDPVAAVIPPKQIVGYVEMDSDSLRKRDELYTAVTTQNRPWATVIVPVWNAHDVATECIVSVQDTLGERDLLVVVDNGSNPAFVPAGMWDDCLFRFDENRGFAAACNYGSSGSPTDILVFLNSDTIVGEGWLDRLLAPFADPTVGAVGPRGNNVSGMQGVWLPDSSLVPFSSHMAQPLTRSLTDRLVGFCIAVRRTAFEQVGGWDESFGHGYEDDDLCRKLLIADWKLLIANDCFVYHHGHASFDAGNVDWYAEQEKARVKYEEKWAGA